MSDPLIYMTMGWSQGNVLAQALNSLWVQRLNRARWHSFPIGRWCSILSMSNNMAMGTEYSTIDCSELTILNNVTEQKWNEPNLVRVGFYRLFQRTCLVERHHVGRWNTRGDSRGCPPWVHFFSYGKKVLARVGDWSKEQMNKGEQSGEVTFHAWCCHHGLPRVSGS